MIIFLLLFVNNLFAFSLTQSHSEVGYEAINVFAKKAEKKYGWILDAIGGSFYDKIRELYVDFNVYKKVDIHEARRFIIKSTEEFLSDINHNKKIKSHLNHYPFNFHDLKIVFSFMIKNGSFIHPPYVAHVLLMNGKISYAILNTNTTHLDDLYEESYEDALKIVQAEEIKQE